MKAPVLGMGYIQWNYWLKVPQGHHQRIQAIGKIIGFLPQTAGEALSLKIMQLIRPREVKVVPT